MSAHFIFPKPRDWNTFEDIVCDLFSRKFDNHNFQRYGRGGQRQNGVDIAGRTTNGLLGIQCKHHPTGNVSLDEIIEEIMKSDGFHPRLDEFVIATSADRDTSAHSHVLEICREREAEGKYPVAIKFWQDIYGWLVEFPDVMYKHFTRYFPVRELQDFRFPGLGENTKVTVCWPTTLASLQGAIDRTIGGLSRIEPYKLTIGLSTFSDVTFDGLVDLVIPLARLFSTTEPPDSSFLEAAKVLNQVKSMMREPEFSRELMVLLHTRLTLAFLFGWVFRRVSNFDLKVVVGDQVWATSGLPLIPSGLVDGLPKLLNQDSDEIALILNISRNIEASVLGFIDAWSGRPKMVLTHSLDGHRVESAAQALSISIDISRRIKAVIDRWGVRRIHLFGAMPAALAVLIGYNLNAICPISIYFLDDTRTEYRLGGTLLNSL